MKVKVNEATGLALDWMVAKANQAAGLIKSDPMLDCMIYYTPTTNWSQGGPIIERAGGTLWSTNANGWYFKGAYDHANDREGPTMSGPTPLIAACRCYVALKLGDKVEVPEGL